MDWPASPLQAPLATPGGSRTHVVPAAATSSVAAAPLDRLPQAGQGMGAT